MDLPRNYLLRTVLYIFLNKASEQVEGAEDLSVATSCARRRLSLLRLWELYFHFLISHEILF